MHNELLLKYNRAIVHMRDRYHSKNFGLVFGAGASLQLGFPSWDELLERIAELYPSITTTHNQPSLAQCIFQAFLSRYLTENKITDQPTLDQLAEIKADWAKLVRDKLYEKVPKSFDEFKKKCTYLLDYIPIIKNAKTTINYNFDDSLQRLLTESRSDEEKDKKRGYRTDWRIGSQMYCEDSVIFHPNGYLPKHTEEKPSDSIVLLDDAFGDQLIESIAGKYTSLLNHYAQTTCLLIGLSLEDPTLQNILRRNAVTHPGHVHYYVKYDEHGDTASPEQLLIKKANFETYNLITLFLNGAQLSDLAKLIEMSSDCFSDLCDKSGAKQKYTYFLTGCVAAGKSTTVSYFRSLSIHDEWLQTMPKNMHKDPSLTETAEIKAIDHFIAEQWRKKNRLLLDAKGILIVDRSPLDAFGFTDKAEWKNKAIFLFEKIFPGKSQDKLQSGTIILLVNKPEMLYVRAISGLRETEIKLLENQQNLLKECYAKVDGIIHLDTFHLQKTEVAKQVCRIIHMDDYKEFNLHTHLEKIKND